MEKPVDWVLIGKYVSGECSDKEKELVDKDPALTELVASLRLYIADRIPSPMDSEIQRIDEAESLKRVHDAIRHMDAATIGGIASTADDGESSSNKNQGRIGAGIFGLGKQAKLMPVLRIAAVFVFLAGVLYLSFNLKSVVEPTGHSLRPNYVFATGRGGRKRLLLADGTEVTLNSVSKIIVAKSYGKGSRTVRLEGEAFFDVAHHKDPPFIVETANGIVQDVGTEFNVRAWPGSGETEVAVRRGEVTLRSEHTLKGKAVSVAAGQMSVAGNNGVLSKPVAANLSQYFAWLKGGLDFDRTPFREVLVDLGRQFPATFVVSDSSLLSKRVTASLARQPLRAILRAISVSLDIKSVNRGDTVLFEQKKKSR